MTGRPRTAPRYGLWKGLESYIVGEGEEKRDNKCGCCYTIAPPGCRMVRDPAPIMRGKFVIVGTIKGRHEDHRDTGLSTADDLPHLDLSRRTP